MKHMKKIIVMTLVMILLVSGNSFAVTENTNESKQEAIRVVNNIRDIYGIKPVVNDRNLENASLKHSIYMFRNDIFTGVEDSNKKNYTAKYPWDRAKASNYLKPYITEIIDSNELSYTDSVQNFINNPYTRMTLLDPKSINYSVSSYGEYITHMIGGEDLSYEYTKKVIYPYNGQKNVPVTWELKKDSATNPYRSYSSLPSSPGYPITYTYYTSQKVSSIKINFSETILVDHNNIEVEIDIRTPDTDKSLTNTILILPKKLSKNTQYKLKVKAEVKKENASSDWISETIYFTTESNNSSELVLSANDIVSRGEVAKILVDGLALPTDIFSSTGFRDVSNSNIYAKYIVTAANNNLMVGFGDGNFGIDDKLTREQIIAIIVKSQELIGNYGRELSYDYWVPFTDMYSVSDWAKISVKKAYKAGLLFGTGDNKVSPNQLITFKECVDFVSRVKR